jgi:hypothetical protein
MLTFSIVFPLLYTSVYISYSNAQDFLKMAISDFSFYRKSELSSCYDAFLTFAESNSLTRSLHLDAT